MKLRDNKGSITVFVLVGLLFMSSFLLLSFGSNVNKSKTAKEIFQMVSNVYSYNDGDENAYMRAYTALRKQNAQEMTSSSENSNTLELTKTFYGPISNYKIYGNSVQNGTPSPTNPVEIRSVGDKTKNLININAEQYKSGFFTPDMMVNFDTSKLYLGGYASSGYMDGEALTSCEIDGTKISFTSTRQWYGIAFPIDVSDQKEYTFSWKTDSGSNIRAQITYYIDGLYNSYVAITSAYSTHTFTTPEGCDIVVVSISPTVPDTKISAYDLMLVEGRITTGYVPEGKYSIPVKVSGKNIVNIPDITSTTSDTSITCNLTEPVVVSCQEYPTSIKNNSGVETSIWRIRFKYLDGTLKYAVDDGLKGKTGYVSYFTASKENPIVEITYRGTYIKEGIYSKIQIEKGTVATEYEPYVEPQTFNIYLDEPLRKVGDVADYIDFSTGKVVRNIAEVVFTGNENWFTSENSVGKYRTRINGFGKPVSETTIKADILSNYYSSQPTQDFYSGAKEGIGIDREGNLHIYDSSFYNSSDITYWKTYLSELYNSGRPLYVNHILTVPDDTETVEIPELKTYEDYTKIEVLTEIAPSKIELTYDGYTFEK